MSNEKRPARNATLLNNALHSVAGGQKCEVYSRIVGYLSPTSRWNKGKTEEFKDRKEYSTTCCK